MQHWEKCINCKCYDEGDFSRYGDKVRLCRLNPASVKIDKPRSHYCHKFEETDEHFYCRAKEREST